MKRFLFIIAIMAGSLFAKAQDAGDTEGKQQEKLQALYVAYITQQLNLTTDEAQKFWPVHADFDRELKAINPDMAELDRQQTALNIKKKYQDKFSKILGAGRTDTFFKKDIIFRDKLAERLRKMRQNRQNQTRPGFRRNN